MFFVYNKDKIVSVVIALSTILILFLISATIKQNTNYKEIQVSAKPSKLVPICAVDTKKNDVAITINCSWNADDIDIILDTLSKNKVKATFFIVGDWAAKFPDKVKKIYESGNEIANHSEAHKNLENLSYETISEQILKCSNRIKKMTGKDTKLFRVPYGKYNDNIVKASEDANHIMIQWSIDTLDYNGLTEEQMWQIIESKINNGSIILMHSVTENTAMSLDKIIKNIKKKGYNLVTVSELIYTKDYNIDNNGVQHKNQ